MGYDDYVDPLVVNFSYYKAYSVQDTKGTDEEWSWSEEGTFFIIIDSTAQSTMDNTTVKYEVSWSPSAWGLLGLSFLTCMVIIFVAAVFGIVILYMIMQSIKAKKGTADESPEPRTSPASDPPPGYETPQPKEEPPKQP